MTRLLTSVHLILLRVLRLYEVWLHWLLVWCYIGGECLWIRMLCDPGTLWCATKECIWRPLLPRLDRFSKVASPRAQKPIYLFLFHMYMYTYITLINLKFGNRGWSSILCSCLKDGVPMKNLRPGRTFPFTNAQQRHLAWHLFGLRINVMKLLVHLADTEGARGRTATKTRLASPSQSHTFFSEWKYSRNAIEIQEFDSLSRKNLWQW